MIGDGSQVPSRYELLGMVRKHSKSLQETALDVSEMNDVEMDARFWQDLTDLYFFRSRETGRREDDDLVFFVKKMTQRHGANAGGDSPYFVRRWAPKLNDLVGEISMSIDWRRSFLLNLIAHTCFSVTVAICSHEVLQQYQADQVKSLSPIYKVVKTVYASPSRINFHLDSKKEVETEPAYPEICFAVDDFDSTFDAVVLNDTDHCYCVLLNAIDGAAFPHNRDQRQVIDLNTPASDEHSTRGKVKKSKITLFSGFVSYQMVREAYDSERSSFGGLLSFGHTSGKTDRIYMKGPGGRGEVEVAVSGILDQTKTELSPKSPIQIPKKGLGIGSIVRTAASVASTAAKHAYAAASSVRHPDEEMLPLKCCLMSVSLPWEAIAHDLLFKGTPPVAM